MIRCLIFSIALLLSVQFTLANRVDNLNTDSDVVKFIASLDKGFRKKGVPNFLLKSTSEMMKDFHCDADAEKQDVKNWIKADFNNDRLTDLLFFIYGQSPGWYVAIDQGNNKFKLVPIYYAPFSGCEIVSVIKSNANTLLSFRHDRGGKLSDDFRAEKIRVTDTLVYKYGDFVDINNNPLHYSVDSIKFETSMCFGTCPVFSIRIDKSGHATYYAEQYNNESGTFNSVINKTKLAEITDVINYISIKRLHDDYSVNWTDYPTCYTTIKFSDGTVKHIKDYGELGTFGLRKLYSLFFALRANQNWQEN